MSDLLYLDNNATTALDPETLEAMLPYLRGEYGNPSSLHPLGHRAAEALAAARAQVAQLFGGRSDEIVFTSGGTEGLNAAVAAALEAAEPDADRREIWVTGGEHSAQLRAVERAAARGFRVRTLGLRRDGSLDAERLIAGLSGATACVALLWANNETGVVIEDAALQSIGEAARAAGATFVLDAVQAAGKLPLRLAERPVDMAVVSAHKFHGPKGVGALWIRRGTAFPAFVVGGPQERERRGGTENVPGIAGLGHAAEVSARAAADAELQGRIAARRDRLESALLAGVPGTWINGAGAPRVANTTNIGFEGLSGDSLLMLLGSQGLCASTGSACDAETSAPSHVLLAMGLAPAEASATLRLSLARETTDADVERAVAQVAEAASQLRMLAGIG